jgi:hypothetical protein
MKKITVLILICLSFSCTKSSNKRVKGYYLSGYHVSKFTLLDDTSEQWYLESDKIEEFVEIIRDTNLVMLLNEHGPIILDIEGEIESNIFGFGQFGHLKSYSTKIKVSKIHSVSLLVTWNNIIDTVKIYPK